MLAGEIVENDEATFRQIVPKSQRFGVGGPPEARLRHIGDGVLPQLRVVEGKDVAGVDAHPRARQLAHNFGEVPLAARIVVAPRNVTTAAKSAATAKLGHLILHAHEREPTIVRHIGQKFRLTPPLRLRRRSGRNQRHRQCADQQRMYEDIHFPRSSSNRACAFSNDGASSSTCNNSRRAPAISPASRSARASS